MGRVSIINTAMDRHKHGRQFAFNSINRWQAATVTCNGNDAGSDLRVLLHVLNAAVRSAFLLLLLLPKLLIQVRGEEVAVTSHCSILAQQRSRKFGPRDFTERFKDGAWLKRRPSAALSATLRNSNWDIIICYNQVRKNDQRLQETSIPWWLHCFSDVQVQWPPH